jgi:ABC-type antimicrobial peptide transport system permease subunit
VYLPYTLEVWPWMSFALRARSPDALVKPVRAAVAALDPAVDFRGEPSVSRTGIASIDAQRRFVTEVLAAFALGALLLAAVGLYGIVAYHVSQRVREIGIRIALGASRGNVLRLVVRDAVTFVLAGAIAGIGGALAAGRVLQSMLFQTTAADWQTFVAVTAVLAATAIAASYLPARRAARTDPTVAMRSE